MKNKYMKIQNLNKFTKHMAKDMCKLMDIEYRELKEYITFSQAKSLVKEYARDDDDGCFSINQRRFDRLTEELHDWILGIELCKLTVKGDLDCYWDDDKNTMIFKQNADLSKIIKLKEEEEE